MKSFAVHALVVSTVAFTSFGCKTSTASSVKSEDPDIYPATFAGDFSCSSNQDQGGNQTPLKITSGTIDRYTFASTETFGADTSKSYAAKMTINYWFPKVLDIQTDNYAYTEVDMLCSPQAELAGAPGSYYWLCAEKSKGAPGAMMKSYQDKIDTDLLLLRYTPVSGFQEVRTSSASITQSRMVGTAITSFLQSKGVDTNQFIVKKALGLISTGKTISFGCKKSDVAAAAAPAQSPSAAPAADAGADASGDVNQALDSATDQGAN